VRDGENYKDILGPNGFNDRNSKGELLLDIYGSHNLRVAHTYCTHDNYTTYVSLDPSKTPSTHNIFAISKELHGKVHNCKVTETQPTTWRRKLKLLNGKLAENDAENASSCIHT
jgi:hypothetical protein